MATAISRTVRAVSAEQTREIRLARIAIARLAPGFAGRLRQSLICELLGRLAAEKERRRVQNLDHWEEHAPALIRAIAERLLAERGEKVAAFLKSNRERWDALAWRVARDADLADLAVLDTAWELWEGRTREEVCCRALKMNARDLLEKRAAGLRRCESLEGMAPAAEACGEAMDFPSHRSDDKDPLGILIARGEQRETNDELAYAVRSVRCRGNRWILQTGWWKSSGLAGLERRLRGSDFAGSPE